MLKILGTTTQPARHSEYLRRLLALTGLACLAALAACNYPVAESPPTAAAVELEQIEAMVGATLVAEGQLTQAARVAVATEDAAGAQAAPTGAPASLETPIQTPSPTFTASPQPTNTPRPSNTPQPTSTPQPTDTPKPTSPPPSNTPVPSATACAKFTNPALNAKPGGIQNQVTLTWGSSGGCPPVTGRIDATYERESKPYDTHTISGNTGTIIDKPPVKCEGTFTINYVLVLVDATGVSITTSTETQVTWIC